MEAVMPLPEQHLPEDELALPAVSGTQFDQPEEIIGDEESGWSNLEKTNSSSRCISLMLFSL